jgi:hypothetical protein
VIDDQGERLAPARRQDGEAQTIRAAADRDGNGAVGPPGAKTRHQFGEFRRADHGRGVIDGGDVSWLEQISSCFQQTVSRAAKKGFQILAVDGVPKVFTSTTEKWCTFRHPTRLLPSAPFGSAYR